jgi:hypothetical protein
MPFQELKHKVSSLNTDQIHLAGNEKGGHPILVSLGDFSDSGIHVRMCL